MDDVKDLTNPLTPMFCVTAQIDVHEILPVGVPDAALLIRTYTRVVATESAIRLSTILDA